MSRRVPHRSVIGVGVQIASPIVALATSGRLITYQDSCHLVGQPYVPDAVRGRAKPQE